VGTNVRVWYNPSDPSSAVLEPGIQEEHKMGLISALFFLVLGLCAVLFM
jgi:hypothetical protein